MRKSLVAQLAEQAAESDEAAPFDRFKDLTKRLVAVPKAEVDAVEAAERRAKPKKPETLAP